MHRWREYAVDAVLFARPEGSPLLEAELGGAIVQLLERTNPYLSMPGRHRLLVNPSVESLEPSDDATPDLTVPSRGTLAGRGRVVTRDGRLAVVDAGVPLLLACDEAPDGDATAPGCWVRFEAVAPVHGFVYPPTRRADPYDGRSIDEAP